MRIKSGKNNNNNNNNYKKKEYKEIETILLLKAID